jgi:exosortase D (VPLPA-CTERM-specific)
VAVFGIRLFDIATVRKGNIIELLPQGATQSVNLEVVEACSGIRSLMTLVTLSLVLAYFTRTKRSSANYSWKKIFFCADSFRAILLMLAAIPIAVITNAARVTATGVITFYYGRQAAEGFLHSFSGWLVYLVALALLFLLNIFLKKIFGVSNSSETKTDFPASAHMVSSGKVFVVVVALLISVVAITWIDRRGETAVPRNELRLLPATLGDWRQQGNDIRFSEETESILNANDYVMRDYYSPAGMHSNIYVGYYSTQRTGATYHSPQNCLPGAGWEMTEPGTVQITKPDGETFKANRFILVTGNRREVLIYWYQGRGRKTASEYEDKLNTIFDSFSRRRSDGAMVRVMTTIGNSQEVSESAALDIAGQLAAEISPFVPD